MLYSYYFFYRSPFSYITLTFYHERLEFSFLRPYPILPKYNHTYPDISHLYYNSGFSTDHLLHFNYSKCDRSIFVSSSTHFRPHILFHRSTLVVSRVFSIFFSSSSYHYYHCKLPPFGFPFLWGMGVVQLCEVKKKFTIIDHNLFKA